MHETRANELIDEAERMTTDPSLGDMRERMMSMIGQVEGERLADWQDEGLKDLLLIEQYGYSRKHLRNPQKYVGKWRKKKRKLEEEALRFDKMAADLLEAAEAYAEDHPTP